MKNTIVLMCLLFWGCSAVPKPLSFVHSESLALQDARRNRTIPIELYFPPGFGARSWAPLILISSGYNGSNTEYTFLARALAEDGFLVAGVQHEQPQDAPIATSGDIFVVRMPVWERGVENLQFVGAYLRSRFPQTPKTAPILIGHSNGGDISLLYARNFPEEVAAVVTLDHRRMPIPRKSHPPVLTFRAGEFEADPGVLPDSAEAALWGINIVRLENSLHNDLRDAGSEGIKQRILVDVKQFIAKTHPNKPNGH
ncbi:MAG: alpha/beta hydrolase [Bacteroidetes Order II. Incertae sedis bacterium]|nr:alpha/beta hydrolase [Bacteroidetes Order II. bacterium]